MYVCVCAPGSGYLNSRLHKRLCVSLTRETLKREKGYAKLLLPPTPRIGDGRGESPRNKEVRSSRWRIPFIRIQIAVYVGKVFAEWNFERKPRWIHKKNLYIIKIIIYIMQLMFSCSNCRKQNIVKHFPFNLYIKSTVFRLEESAIISMH